MISGEERRKLILDTIKNSKCAVSGTMLAHEFGVSRQIIVSDIALLRASHYDIISTNRGYIINQISELSRVIKVHHSDDEIEDELNTIVDLGATVKDVYVNHKVYGTIKAELNIRSRKDVKDFINEIHSGKSTPLKNVTSNYHYHTITSDTNETLDLVYNALKEKGYVVNTK